MALRTLNGFLSSLPELGWNYNSNYSVSQKTSHLSLAITLTYMNRLW